MTARQIYSVALNGALWGTLLGTLFCSEGLYADPIGAQGGVELGGNGTMFTGTGNQGFGMGAGYQGSAFFSLWTNRPLAGKLRFETIHMSEVALTPSSTDEIEPGTKLKSMTQNWNVISAGVEGRFESQGQKWYWEALLGYAMGKDGQVSVSYGEADRPSKETAQTTRSTFALSGGVGFMKNLHPKVIGLMTMRTMFLLGQPYSSLDKAYLLFPLIFNIGIAVPFNF